MYFTANKNSAGKVYVYLRENQWINKKSVCTFSVSLGTADQFITNMFIFISMASCISPINNQDISEFGPLFIAKQAMSCIDIASIIDGIIDDKDRCKSLPTSGKFFEYAIINRMISPNSKNKMPNFLNKFDTEILLPEISDVNLINSKNYWDKFNNVSEEQLDIIKLAFFDSVYNYCKSIGLEPLDYFALDNTNIYTYFDNVNCHCSFAKYGHSKEGRDSNLIIGLALLVDRNTKIPFDYVVYPGNIHDSKELFDILPNIIKVMKKYGKKSVTICFDKGMNSVTNIDIIDSDDGTHFITAYSPHYLEDLMSIDIKQYTNISDSNSRLDGILFYETKKILWKKERRIIITYNSSLFKRQRQHYIDNVVNFRKDLKEIRKEFKQNLNKLTESELKKTINSKLEKLCSKYYLPKNLYTASFEKKEELTLHLTINTEVEKKYVDKFGKNIIVTDIFNWSSYDIINASKDRNIVEESFKMLKDNSLIQIRPTYHWTDSKVKCHIFCCVAALTYLRILENKVRKSIKDITAKTIMEEMDKLKVSNTKYKGFKNEIRFFSIKGDNSIVNSILEVFGYYLKHGELLKIGQDSKLDSLLKLLKRNGLEVDVSKGQNHFLKQIKEAFNIQNKSLLKERTQSNFIFRILTDNPKNQILSNLAVSLPQDQITSSTQTSSVLTTADISLERPLSNSPLTAQTDSNESFFTIEKDSSDEKKLYPTPFLSNQVNLNTYLSINTPPVAISPTLSTLSDDAFFISSEALSVPTLPSLSNQKLTAYSVYLISNKGIPKS